MCIEKSLKEKKSPFLLYPILQLFEGPWGISAQKSNTRRVKRQDFYNRGNKKSCHSRHFTPPYQEGHKLKRLGEMMCKRKRWAWRREEDRGGSGRGEGQQTKDWRMEEGASRWREEGSGGGRKVAAEGGKMATAAAAGVEIIFGVII